MWSISGTMRMTTFSLRKGFLTISIHEQLSIILNTAKIRVVPTSCICITQVRSNWLYHSNYFDVCRMRTISYYIPTLLQLPTPQLHWFFFYFQLPKPQSLFAIYYYVINFIKVHTMPINIVFSSFKNKTCGKLASYLRNPVRSDTLSQKGWQ